MLSELRKRKLRRFFDVIDANHDGLFTGEDIEIVGRRLTALRGMEPGSEGFENFMRVFRFYWDDFRKAADKNADGKVTPEEWIDYHDMMLADEKRFEATAHNSASVMFGLMDDDADGVISTAQYKQWMEAWGMADDETSEEVFAKLDPEGTGTFTKDRVLAFTREFFYSEDENAGGNWAMGPW